MNMLPTKTVEVDGFTYDLTMLGALQGRKLWLTLAKILAKAASDLAEFSTLKEEAMIVAISKLVEHIDATTYEELNTVFAKNCRVHIEAKEPLLSDVYDLHFAGRYLAATQWLAECVMFNFASFLGDTSLGSLLAQFKGVASPSPSQTNSTGSSGVSSPTDARP